MIEHCCYTPYGRRTVYSHGYWLADEPRKPKWVRILVDHDDFTQAGNLYRLFDDAPKDRLTTRLAGVLKDARPEVQMRQLCHFFRADPDYGRRVADKLGLDVSGFRQQTAAVEATRST